MNAKELGALLKSGVAKVRHGRIILPSQPAEPTPPVSESEDTSETDFLDSLGGSARPLSARTASIRARAAILFLLAMLLGALIVDVLT
jgi:hypothetical protein